MKMHSEDFSTILKGRFPVIYVVNSMGWDRSATVRLFIDYEILPSDRKFSVIDLESGKRSSCTIFSRQERRSLLGHGG